jgi:hypothetical protein
VAQLVAEQAKFVDMPRGFLISNWEVALAEALDILVFTDIGMDMSTMMWASARLAPVQVRREISLL